MAQEKKSKKGEGFHSAAGLIRYYDAEEEFAIKIDPRAVIAMAVATSAVVMAAAYLWPV